MYFTILNINSEEAIITPKLVKDSVKIIKIAVKLPIAEKTEALNPELTDLLRHIKVLGPGVAVSTRIANK